LLAALPTVTTTCHYQPKINARDGSIHSVEALLLCSTPAAGYCCPE